MSQVEAAARTTVREDAPAAIDIAHVRSSHSRWNRLGRAVWKVAWLLLYRPSPTPCHAWRRGILRLFGAKISPTAEPYPAAKIWAPWNLELGAYSTIANDVDCYCVAPVRIGAHATVSQYSYLCTASHDYAAPRLPLTSAAISIGDGVWIAADVFVAPGVSIGDGAVVGARSSVFRDIPPWTVAFGHPARAIKPRRVDRRNVCDGEGGGT